MARALRDWLPRVIQALQPFMSEADISKGMRWEQEIGQQLDQARFGIFCLTAESLNARWINFEAGALSKTVERASVCTYLLDLKATEIEGPLSQFNHTVADKEDTRRLIYTLNRALGEQALGESIVDETFELYWPRLERDLGAIPLTDARAKSLRPIRRTDAMVEEILELVRYVAGNTQPSAVKSNDPRPRLPTTLSWAADDADLLYVHYCFIQDKYRAGEYDDHLTRLTNDETYAKAWLATVRAWGIDIVARETLDSDSSGAEGAVQ